MNGPTDMARSRERRLSEDLHRAFTAWCVACEQDSVVGRCMALEDLRFVAHALYKQTMANAQLRY